MIKLLHFADAHIDIARQGRHDPDTGLPVRVMDFLKALDTIVDTAVNQHVDLVIFAGDAYRDRTPAPTFQREWGKRMLRLSQAGIFTLLVVGNHDLSPAVGRAHALQEYETLQIPNIYVISKPCLLHPSDLNNLPLQVIGLPWINRYELVTALEKNGLDTSDIGREFGNKIVELLHKWINELDQQIPAVLTSHISVQGATYGNERSVMLGRDMTLAASLVCDPRLDYVALGHIHKAQNLNKGARPPVIYPGSIERVDFGESNDQKQFVIAEVEKGRTKVTFYPLNGRKFIDRKVEIKNSEGIMEQLFAALPPKEELADAMVRLIVSYPREWELLIDEPALRHHAERAFEFHFIKRPQLKSRFCITSNQSVSQMSPLELLDIYWQATGTDEREAKALSELAKGIIQSARIGEGFMGEQGSLEGVFTE